MLFLLSDQNRTKFLFVFLAYRITHVIETLWKHTDNAVRAHARTPTARTQRLMLNGLVHISLGATQMLHPCSAHVLIPFIWTCFTLGSESSITGENWARRQAGPPFSLCLVAEKPWNCHNAHTQRTGPCVVGHHTICSQVLGVSE
jgi:hypothetical protein